MDKKSFQMTLLGIIFLSSLSCHGQEKDSLLLRHEVSASIGYVSMFDLFATIGSWGKYKALPEIHIQYLYNTNKHIGLGGLFFYEHFGKGKEHGDILALMPVSRFYWFNKKKFAMYSKVSAGIIMPE